MALPVYSTSQIATYLTDTYWGLSGNIRHHFPVSPGGSISINMSSVSAAGQSLANSALQAWTMVSGINFQITNLAGAEITFTDTAASNPTGGSSWSLPSGAAIDGYVNVPASWLPSNGTTVDSYSFSTYMHEIGHALGLGHAGAYDGAASYQQNGSGSNHYLNDSWQASIMSYFSPSQNSYIAANWDYFGALTGVMTPMIADIAAIQDLYGVASNLRTGDTVYGVGSTAGGYYDTAITAKAAFTLVDNGGVDTINFSTETANQSVDLNGGAISSVGGLIGNMVIMTNTIIENFVSGAGADSIIGNAANNSIWGGAGQDSIHTGDGDDFVKGEQDSDTIRGGAGDDVLNGNGRGDMLFGEGGNDILRGGNSKDRLNGGDGDDILMGGIGRDKLIGGAGADTFVFKAGWAVDRVNDFEDNIDTIELHSSLWGGGLTIAQVISTYGASNVANNGNAGTHVELNFGGGDVLKIHGISDANLLLDDISII